MAVSLSEVIGIAKKISQQQISIGITNVEFVSPNTLKFTLADASIYNITIPELHTHSNLSDILEKFTVDTNGKLLFDGKLIEGSGASVDLSNYYSMSQVDNLINNKTDINDTIISPTKTYSSNKIDSTYVKKETGKNLFSGSYNDLIDKPQLGITDLSTFTTDDLVESATKKFITTAQISEYSNKQDKSDITLNTTDKTVVGGINEVNQRAENIETDINTNIRPHLTDNNNPHNTKISNLGDASITTPVDRQILIYDIATSKWTNESVSIIDEKVKASATGSSQYLDAIVDGTTCAIESDKLVVKSLQGMNVSIAEINTLQGMDTNIKTLFNTLASAGMTYTGIVGTKAELNAVVGATLGNVKIVISDETQSNKRMAYIYSDTATWESVGEANITQRDFQTNPIKLSGIDKEIVGVLEQAHMDLSGIVKTSDLANYTTTTDLQATYSTKLEVSSKANSVDIYTKTEADTLLDGKANSTHTHEIADVNSLQSSIDNKVDKVTGKSLVDDSEITRLSNITGTNTGDETQATIKTKLGQATTTSDGYLSSVDWNTFNNKADKLNTMPQTSYGSTSTNLNTILTTGIYYCSAWTNYPTQHCADGQGTVIIYKYVTGWEKQIFITPHENAMYTRTRVNSIWGEWEKFITNKVVSNPNLLINSNFKIWQRGTSKTVTSRTYLCDRWKAGCDTGSALVEKTANGLKATLQSTGNIIIDQITDTNELDISGKTVTLSCMATTNTPSINLCIYAYVGGTWNALSYSPIKSGELTQTTATIPYNATSYVFEINTPSNTVASGNYIELNNMKLELGYIATQYVPKLYGEELALCQRYYRDGYLIGCGLSNNQLNIQQNFPIYMRENPALTISSVTNLSNGGAITFPVSGYNCNAKMIGNIISSSAGSVVAGTMYGIQYTADAEIY